jgi:hypothetical protein
LRRKNMENFNDKTQVTADTAEAEKEKKMLAAAGLGKFKDIKTLIDAYSSLEAEFTRRSIKLKELEEMNKAQTPSDGAESAPSPQENKVEESQTYDEKVRDAVIAEYLKAVAEGKSVPLVSGGGGVAAPRRTYKTVKEAGRLVQEFLK